MDAGSAGHDHARAKVPYMGLRIICSEEMASFPRANKKILGQEKVEKDAHGWSPEITYS